MTITKNMLLYFIRDMKMADLPETMQEQTFSGIQYWMPNMKELKTEYLYLCDGCIVPEVAEQHLIENNVCMLVIFSKEADQKEQQDMMRNWKTFHQNASGEE